MAILNYSTKIDYHKTIGEISSILVKHGASKITVDYADGIPDALTFVIPIAGNKTPTFYSLPARYRGVLKALQKQKVTKSLQTEEQALRIAWRNVKDWLAAQMAMVEAEQCEIQEIFLPYIVLKSGNTLYDDVKNENIKLLK